MMNRPYSEREFWAAARAQLALDLNCSPDDFLREGVTAVEFEARPGRRPFPLEKNVVQAVTFGPGVVLSAPAALLPRLRYLQECGRDEVFEQPFVRGLSLYFLPDPARLTQLPFPQGIEIELVEQKDIAAFYALDEFHNALNYDVNHPRPDILAAAARHEGRVVGMAGASADCEQLWQVGIDVLPEQRGRGLAAALVALLSLEILDRGRIPYYGTSVTNIASQRTAHRAGYEAAWSCVWETTFNQ